MDTNLLMQIGIVLLINVGVFLIYRHVSHREDVMDLGEAAMAPPPPKPVRKPAPKPAAARKVDEDYTRGYTLQLRKTADLKEDTVITEENTARLKRQTLDEFKTRRK